MRAFRELLVWQKAHALTLALYKSTASFPAADLGLLSRDRHGELDTAVTEVKRMLTGLAKKLTADR